MVKKNQKAVSLPIDLREAIKKESLRTGNSEASVIRACVAEKFRRQ